MRTDYTCVSADSHLEVSPDRWRGFVPDAHREWVPQVVKCDNGGDAWRMPASGNLIPVGLVNSGGGPWEDLKATGVSYDDLPPGSGTPEQRLREMAADGVDAEVLFPAVHGQRAIAGAAPPVAELAIVRGYNDWLASAYCSAAPQRLLGCAILPTTGVDDAIAELARVAEAPTLRTVVLHRWPDGGLTPSEADDRFWAAALEMDVPISVHVSLGGGRAADVPREGWPSVVSISANLTRGLDDSAYCVTQFITSGVFDRFPGLRIAMAEVAAGWLPYYIEQLDENYRRHRHWSGLTLDEQPSTYVRRNFAFGFQRDFHAIESLHRIGPEALMWASDFPHASTDWPDSQKLLRAMLGDLSDDDAHAIVCGNAVDFYHLNV